MPLYVRQNGTTYNLGNTPGMWYSFPTSPSLCTREGRSSTSQMSVYYPLVEAGKELSIGSNVYRYDPSIYPRLAFRYNGKTYYVPNVKFTPSIRSGTYAPSDFESLIMNFISQNGYREAAQDFSVTVNGQTVEVKTGERIYYTVNSSSPMGFVRHVGFGEKSLLQEASCYQNFGFSSYKQYVTYCSVGSGFRFVTLYKTYADYKIKVNSAICFK